MLNYDSPNLPNLSHLSFHLLLNSDEMPFTTPHDTARLQQFDTEPFALFRQQQQQSSG